MSDPDQPPRYLPGVPLPPYSYVSGRFPHPTSDPRGHSFGEALPEIQPPDADLWRECAPYLRGIDLFNYGYYWEAHETWESLWHACGRSGPTAWFLQGLIKLAAAGVKAREQRPNGVRRHIKRCLELLQQAADTLPTEECRYMGLDVSATMQTIGTSAEHAIEEGAVDSDASVHIVFGFALTPE